MSVEAMSRVFKHSKASPAAKLVLLAIADHESDRGAWPSERTLSLATNMSERSVRRKVAELVELGELSVEVNASPIAGRYKSNLYWVLVGRVDNSDIKGGQNEHQGWTDQAVRVDTADHITIKEPLLTKRETFSIDWMPDDALQAWCQSVNPNLNPAEATAAMIDYLLASGKDKAVKDMAARFRTWVRNSVKFEQVKPASESVKFLGDRL